MKSIRVRIVPEGTVRIVRVEEPVTGRDLFRILGYPRGSYVILVNGSPVPETDRIDSDEVVLVRVLSGG